MPRKTDLNILTLFVCMTVAVALGMGCESKPSKSDGNANTAADTSGNSTKGVSTDDHDSTDADTGADTSISDDDGHDDHDGHDHGAADHSDDDGTVSADSENVINLGTQKIERRPSGVRPTNKRDATGDMIYATVRVQMDHLIAERKELLDGGMDPTDPEVRQKETSIRKAVSLLTQNGEIVGPIDPPIDGLDLAEGS